MTATAWGVLCYCFGLVTGTVGLIALVKAGLDAKKAILGIIGGFAGNMISTPGA